MSTHKKINYILLFAAGFIVIFCAQNLYGFDAMAQYNKAIRYIKMKQPDFALMEFRGVARDFPKSVFARKAMFAMAEYYYDNKIYYDAIDNFTRYINDYPKSKASVFAKAYLLKITQDIKYPSPDEKKAFETIKNDFFSKPLFLILKEYKKTSYKSPSLNRFRIKHNPDNIELYRNNQIFLTLTP